MANIKFLGKELGSRGKSIRMEREGRKGSVSKNSFFSFWVTRVNENRVDIFRYTKVGSETVTLVGFFPVALKLQRFRILF